MQATFFFATSYGGFDGFLGTRASLMMDLVVCAMLLVMPLMLLSVYLVRARKFRWHKRLQTTLVMLLLVTIALFEIDVRVHGWSERADASPYWRDGGWNDLIDLGLGLHLCFAIPTPLVWGVLVWLAYRRFPRPLQPSDHSRFHRRWGRLAVIAMSATTVTGWLFYWLAFVAT